MENTDKTTERIMILAEALSRVVKAIAANPMTDPMVKSEMGFVGMDIERLVWGIEEDRRKKR